MSYFLLVCFLIYILNTSECPSYTATERTVAFENNLKHSNHQLSADDACFISLESCLHQVLWKHTGLSEKPFFRTLS